MDTSKNTPPPDLHKLTHDIRNIMGAISNYAQVLELSLDESTMGKEVEVVRAILGSIKDMDALVTKIDEAATTQAKAKS
jgi:light-regulated signal transduction histidine kinase (bacteriophytochrome)